MPGTLSRHPDRTDSSRSDSVHHFCADGNPAHATMASEREINGGVGLCQQIKILGGILKPIPLSAEHAKAALRRRVVGKIPPSGVNNEQFAIVAFGKSRLSSPLSVLCTWCTNDSGFYEGPERSHGVSAEPLRQELAGSVVTRSVSTLVFGDLLQGMDTAVLVLDAATIAEVIVGAVTPRAGRLSQNGLEASSWDVHFSPASEDTRRPNHR